MAVKLRQSDLFDNHPLPSWICEPKTLQIIDVNRAALKWLGLSRAKLLEKKFPDLLVASIKLSKTKSVLGNLVQKKGGSQPMQFSTSGILSGKKTLTMIVGTPITRNEVMIPESGGSVDMAMRWYLTLF